MNYQEEFKKEFLDWDSVFKTRRGQWDIILRKKGSDPGILCLDLSNERKKLLFNGSYTVININNCINKLFINKMFHYYHLKNHFILSSWVILYLS